MRSVKHDLGHTPGPWEVKEESDSRFLIYSEDYGHIVWVSCDPDVQAQMDFVRGDAHAISAAPELLAACKALVAHDKNGRFGKPSFPEAINAARAAIAKAEGRA